MITIHPRDARVIAHEQARRLRADAVRIAGPPSVPRRAVAAWLQSAAKRLDPPAFAPRTA